MSYVPNLRSSGRVAVPTYCAYSDVLFDYASFLRAVETSGSIAKYQGEDRVAVIGSGVAGIVAAYELRRAGVKVTLFGPDYTDNRAGRCYSMTFPDAGPVIAEMGAMRFPPTEVCLFHYLSKFDIQYTDNFPDPGKVDTLLYANGQIYEWKKGETNPPAVFGKINNGFSALRSEDLQFGSQRLKAPDAIATLLQSGSATDLDLAKAAWQAWVDAFEPYSFRAALTLVFQQEDASYIPGGVPWTSEDIELFGTLGVGSGGFGALYSVSFLEMIRLFVNQLEKDQVFIPGGIASVFYKMMNDKLADGSTLAQSLNSSAVTGVLREDSGGFKVTYDGSSEGEYFSSVIMTASNWSIPINTNLVSSSTPSLLDDPEKQALRNQHIITSSKTFVITESKFWIENPGIPANIQTDTLARGVYCLDYDPNDGSIPGVVLLSYTWQDDSAKQLGPWSRDPKISEKQARVTKLKEDIAGFAPDFAKYLVPKNEDYEQYVAVIDWELETYYHGAFKLNQPGQSYQTAYTFRNFQKAETAADDGFYVAGDGSSFYGGWTEGAFQTGLNAATAALRYLKSTSFVEPNPLKGVRTGEFNYHTGPHSGHGPA